MQTLDLKQKLLGSMSGKKWQKIGTHKRAGILVPLFSVYSQQSCGIGDFFDLKLVIDWAVDTGNSIVQLLPLNEVGVTFCPYDSLSSYALDPMYISLEMLDCCSRKPVRLKIDGLKKRYPTASHWVNYRIKQEKIALLREIFLSEKDAMAKPFEDFVDRNLFWINDFALFKALKHAHNGSSWLEWPAYYRDQEKSALEKFFAEHETEILFEMWMQWLLYTQFCEIKAYAQKKQVLLKGDLPILVSTDSADVWSHPEYFKLECAAGAPPDMYCEKGQRWGTPTYNWGKIADEGYHYLKEKLKYAEHFYDILRIDHVVGLFRIWSIPFNEPGENQGLHGFFDPQDESTWGAHGRNLLKVMLEATGMLLCAEDLGVVPKACTESLDEFGIPGNEVQRWVKDWDKRHDFLTPDEYRLVSVAMLSTHDTTNWAAWWENEAGTVDEALFKRKCSHRGIDYPAVKGKLFDQPRSRHGRLRWLLSVVSSDMLVSILGKRREEVMDFIDMYENSFREKEKLWALFKLKGTMQEESDPEIIARALQFTLDSSAIFCIHSIFDWLSLAKLLSGDPYQYRVNTPGTVGPHNWSLRATKSLEELLAHPSSACIKNLILASERK